MSGKLLKYGLFSGNFPSQDSPSSRSRSLRDTLPESEGHDYRSPGDTLPESEGYIAGVRGMHYRSPRDKKRRKSLNLNGLRVRNLLNSINLSQKEQQLDGALFSCCFSI